MLKPTTNDTEIDKKIIEALKTRKINVETTEIKYGPRFNRYHFTPRIPLTPKKTEELKKDISKAISCDREDIVVIPQIPGEYTFGVEIAHSDFQPLLFEDYLESIKEEGTKNGLVVPIGVDVENKLHFYDITNTPDLLIGGAIGSGKSQFLHSTILSLTANNNPNELKIILSDVKRVEFEQYKNIPHLLFPFLKSPEEIVEKLEWLLEEMIRRYKAMDEEKNKAAAMPKIIFIIDEFYEVSLLHRSAFEGAVQRLALFAKNAGIHLIMSASRPSEEIITIVIKVNIPSRLAFRVTRKADSEVILDQPGAEELLGKGDMLFSPRDVVLPIRLQGLYVSDKYIKSVVENINT